MATLNEQQLAESKEYQEAQEALRRANAQWAEAYSDRAEMGTIPDLDASESVHAAWVRRRDVRNAAEDAARAFAGVPNPLDAATAAIASAIATLDRIRGGPEAPVPLNPRKVKHQGEAAEGAPDRETGTTAEWKAYHAKVMKLDAEKKAAAEKAEAEEGLDDDDLDLD